MVMWDYKCIYITNVIHHMVRILSKEQVVTIRLDPKMLKKIDLLVKSRHFPNRSSAIRMLLHDALKRHLINSIEQEMIKTLDSPRTLSDEALHEIGKHIFSSDTARIVAEGRER